MQGLAELSRAPVSVLREAGALSFEGGLTPSPWGARSIGCFGAGPEVERAEDGFVADVALGAIELFLAEAGFGLVGELETVATFGTGVLAATYTDVVRSDGDP